MIYLFLKYCLSRENIITELKKHEWNMEDTWQDRRKLVLFYILRTEILLRYY